MTLIFWIALDPAYIISFSIYIIYKLHCVKLFDVLPLTSEGELKLSLTPPAIYTRWFGAAVCDWSGPSALMIPANQKRETWGLSWILY